MKTEKQKLQEAYRLIGEVFGNQPVNKHEAGNLIKRIWEHQAAFNDRLASIQRNLEKCIEFVS